MDLYKKILELDSVYEGDGQQPGGFTTNNPNEAIKEIVRRMFPGVNAQIPISENLQLNLGPGVNEISAGGHFDVGGGELSIGGGMSGDDKAFGIGFRKQFDGGGLSEEYYGKSQSAYQKAVEDGFQGTYEEYLRLISPTKSFADGGMLVQPGFGGVRQGYKQDIKPPTKKQLEITEKVYSKKYNKTGIDLWESLKQFERSNIRQGQVTGGTGGIGKLKKNQISKDDFIKLVNANKDKTYNQFVEILKDYKTKDNKPFTKNIVADRLRDYGLSGTFKKEPPKEKDLTKKAETEKKRQKFLKDTDPTGAKGTKQVNYHHIRQIAGGVPLTTDDVMLINQRINSQLGGETNKALNRISAAIQKNNRLALEAMNAKEESLALEYMKRSDDLNAQAEKIVNSAIDKLPKKYKGYVGFNQFTLPRDEYGFPISNEPLIVKKVGGMPVSKDAIDLTDLNLKQEEEFKKLVRTQAETGKTGKIKGLKAFMKANGIKCIVSKSNGGPVTCDMPQAYEKSLNELGAKAQAGDNVAQSKLLEFGKKTAKAGRVIKNVLGPYAIATEVALGVPLGLYGYAKGQPLSEIANSLSYGLAGQSQDERLKEEMPDYGAAQNLDKVFERLSNLERLEKGTRGQILRSKPKVEQVRKELKKLYQTIFIVWGSLN